MLNFNNADKRLKNYMYQNLQKSKSFNSTFSESKFDYASFRGAHLKACNFNGCSFVGAEFIGANLKGSFFKKAIFENTVFEGTKLEGADFKGATFKNTFMVATEVDKALNLNLADPEIKVFSEMPELELNEALKLCLERLMVNPYVKKSRVLDTKDKKMNTISVMILQQNYTDEQLLEALPKLESLLDRDFYCLSYLLKAIGKLLQ